MFEKRKPFFLRKEFMSWSILIIMALSALGMYATNYTEDKSSIEYNGYSFYSTGSVWQVKVNGQDYQFRYLPGDLEEYTTGKFESADKVYIAYNPQAKNITLDYSITQLYDNLIKTGSRPVLACNTEDGCLEDLPIVSCENAKAPVILLRSAEEKKVINEGKCTIIQAQQSVDIEKYVTRLNYQLAGIMKNE